MLDKRFCQISYTADSSGCELFRGQRYIIGITQDRITIPTIPFLPLDCGKLITFREMAYDILSREFPPNDRLPKYYEIDFCVSKNPESLGKVYVLKPHKKDVLLLPESGTTDLKSP